MAYIGKTPTKVPLTSSDIPDSTISQDDLVDQAVNEAKLQVSNAPTNGYFLSAQSGNTGGLTWAEASGGIGNIYQVTYKDSTSYSGSGRGNSDVVAGLNATFTRQSQTSKTLLSYSVFVGTTSDVWVLFKIQYSTNGSSFTDVPDISNTYNSSVPRGHFGNANRGGSSNGTDYETSNIAYEYLHDTSSISSSTIYYRIILFKGHGSNNATIYINRSHDMGNNDVNRNTYPSNFIMKEIL
jgi:hypothetical protein